MAKTYVTLGQGHTHRINNQTLDRDCIAVIECEDERHGRALAEELLKMEFHRTFFEEKFDQRTMHYFPRGMININ
jgi:hypothetical protein